jgi:hypothetical protein
MDFSLTLRENAKLQILPVPHILLTVVALHAIIILSSKGMYAPIIQTHTVQPFPKVYAQPVLLIIT